MFAGALFILPIYMMREIFNGPERLRTKLILCVPLCLGLFVSVAGVLFSLGQLMFSPQLKSVTTRNGAIVKTYYLRGIAEYPDIIQTIEYQTLIPKRLYWIRQLDRQIDSKRDD